MISRLELKKDFDRDLIMAFLCRMPTKEADDLLCEFVGYKIKMRLQEQREKGFGGWNTPQISNKELLSRLKRNLDKGDLIDVINLAGMILARSYIFEEIGMNSVKVEPAHD